MSSIQLINAVDSGNVKRVKSLLAQNANVNSRLNSITALMRASYFGKSEIVDILLDAGANINLRDFNGATALIWAAKGGDPDIVQSLIRAGSNIDFQSIWGETALIGASVNNNLGAVRTLILNGANIDIEDADGKTAYDSTKNEEIELFIDGYRNLNELRKNRGTYLFVIPRDLIGVIRDQL